MSAGTSPKEIGKFSKQKSKKTSSAEDDDSCHSENDQIKAVKLEPDVKAINVPNNKIRT